MRRRAVSIGVDVVSGFSYGRRLRPLNAAASDARAVGQLVRRRGYATTVLADRRASTLNVKKALADAAEALHAGDRFVLAFSGHGVAAETGDGFQQSWCLYDQPLSRFGHDGLDAALSAFRAGVRILVLVNCCHSGVRTAMTPRTPDLRAHVVRIAACSSGGKALDKPEEDNGLSPFTRELIEACRLRRRGIFDLYDELARRTPIRPELEINHPRSEDFLREGF